MGYDVDYRENDVTAIDTATALTEQGADSPGAFIVPEHAGAITEIIITVGCDWTTDVIEGFTTAIRLTGPGLNAPESWIGGPVGLTTGATNIMTSSLIALPQRVLCNIPVVPGQKINCYAYMHGSADMGSLRVSVTLVYDGPEVGTARYFDYREGDTAAANTLVTLTNRGGAAEADFDVGSGEIVEVLVGTGGVVVAGPLAAIHAFHLSGNGLQTAGNYRFTGHSISVDADAGTIASQANIVPCVRYKVSIGTKTGKIRVQAQEIEDDVGTPSNIITFGYA